ncbi:MAG TPA: pilus assembly protein PilM [Polyangia bacterium]|nr:pilus assembly protein PilM [Polyangia bacterium]
MAHTVCGIDLGTYSVKLALLEAGFRQTTLRGLDEIMVPPGDAPLLERQMQAAREALSHLGGEVTPYVAIPGDQLSVRVLDLPFSEARKIDQVVGYELESQIVSPIEDVVFDYLVAAQRAEGTTVLAAAAKREEVAAFLATADAQGVHPRSLYAAPVIYRSLFPAGFPAAAPAAVEPAAGEVPAPVAACRAVVDFGHERTNICIIRDGHVLFARTIRRGGAHLTAAIARAFGADLERAEQAKRGEAFLASPGRLATTPLLSKLDAVLREALAPTIRELRQTLASFSAGSHQEVQALLVVGGGGRLAGLLTFLEAELGIPARHPSVREVLEAAGRPGAEPAGDEGGAPEADVHALAGAIALAAARGSREIDFRRGPFAYRANYSILRQKAGHLATLAAAMLLAAGIDMGAKLSSLRTERKSLDKDLKTATQELFGKPREDAEAVTELLRKGFREELAPLPKATAFDLLDQISRKVPPADKIKLDVAELEIRPKKTFIKGTVDTAAAVDEIAGKLKEIDCFEEVTKGAITEVSGGAKQFTLNVATKCP